MKKCIACMVLMCFALAACATVTNQPTTEPQMNVTTTNSTATTIPATNSTVTTVPPASSTVATTLPTKAPTTVPVTSCTPTTVPTTKPTTPTTLPSGTAPSFSAGTVIIGARDKVEVVAGHQTIIPLFGFLWSEYYYPQTGGWMCGDGMGIRFERYEDDQIPAIRLTGTVNIHLPQNYELSRIYLQTEKNGKTEEITVGALSSLAPGTYYVKFSTIKYGQIYDEKQERYSSQHGFRLIVPEIAKLQYPTVTATWPKLPTVPVTPATTPTTATTPTVKPNDDPFSHVPVPGPYTLRQVGNKYYIDFGPGENKRYPLDHGCLRYPNAIGYNTMEQMYQAMLTGDFSVRELQIIRAVFPLDPEYGFELPNPYDPHELKTPDAVSFKHATLSSRGLVVRFGTPDGTPEEQIIQGYLEFLREDEFNRRVDTKFNNFYWDDREFDFTAVAVPERNATAYDAHIGTDDRMIRILVY